MLVVKSTSHTGSTVTIKTLTDEVYGDLNGRGDCLVPQTIPTDSKYVCRFTAFMTVNAADEAKGQVVASGTDD